ncbi:hypothetical protein J5Y09_04825 [Roseomonas sp. PWR1]|uniref:EthD domain-containing protein n=1 Tax=Roseomonas nitratireducens TaxID=2820810 RepID=A0ABS4APD7_9PROT|nr:DUF4286 family protein [Neoroseomonas nitratireducens]MBP0463225.1 hypothetical protein [Neoroseomonas nitratireducens]
MATGGIISVLNDLGEGCDRADYEAWYQQDHLPDRLSVPGFRHARRYRRIAGPAQEYFTFYETDSSGVLRTPAYQRRLAEPTAWTTRMMPHFRAMNRTVCDIAADAGAGIGGIVALLGGGRPVAADGATLADLPARPGVTRARLWRAAEGMPANPEAALRPGGDASFSAILLVEGTSEAAVMAAAREAAAGLGMPGDPATYALIYASP